VISSKIELLNQILPEGHIYDPNEKTLYLNLLAVHIHFRKQGIGSFLLKEMMNYFKEEILSIEQNQTIFSAKDEGNSEQLSPLSR